MYCHEIWQYEHDVNGIDSMQKLTGLIALCVMCHYCKHLGRTGILARKGGLDYELMAQHFMRVNQCTREEFEAEAQEAFDIWKERNEYIWTPDLGDYAYLVQAKVEQESLWNLLEQEPAL
jgi:hypothetical protein